jgi:hypothetical protein
MVQEPPEIAFAREQEKQRLENDPQAIYAETLREDKVSNILSQINPDNLLSDIEHRIRGEKKNIYTNQWQPISEGIEPISPLLISNFMSFLGSTLNQSTAMSNFSNNEINNLMDLIIDWVSNELRTNAKLYGIEGKYTEYSRIGHIICLSCFTVFKRALNGQESRRVFKIFKVSESSGGQKKGGFIENLKFW